MANEIGSEIVWNVFREIPNRWCIEPYNIFKHGCFREDVKKVLKTSRLNKAEKEEKIRRCLQYYFWCKCEHEIVICGFPPSTNPEKDYNKGKKVDIYTQVMMNWDIFFDYLWKNKKLLLEEKNK